MARVVDVDSHVYEPASVWEDYVPAAEREAAQRAFFHEIGPDGTARTVLNGQPARELNRSRIVRQAVWHPGMSLDDIGALDPDQAAPLNPGAWDPAARLSDLDTLGIDVQVLYPTLFGEYLPQVVDGDAAVALARAYNDWIWDFASAGAGRFVAVAILPLQQPALAVAEVERVAAKGFKAVMIRPAFYKLDTPEGYGGMLAAMARAGQSGPRPVFVEDKPYRPVWEKADQLGLTVCVHPYLGSTGTDAVSSGGFAERVSERVGAAHPVAEPIAYMQDADLFTTAALSHGLLEDLPDLRLAIAHAGTTWVPLALEKAETYLWLGQPGGVAVCLEPEEVWERHPLIVSFDSWEKPVARMPDVLGKQAAWGSRYPNHDTGTPDEARAMLGENEVDQATVDALLGGHAEALFNL